MNNSAERLRSPAKCQESVNATNKEALKKNFSLYLAPTNS